MKNKFLTGVAIASLSLIPCLLSAEDNPSADLKDLVKRTQTSFGEGKRSEAEQADHLKEFDELLAKYRGQTNDDVANIAYMRATLYSHIFHNPDKAVELLEQLQRDFPDTKSATHASAEIASIKAGVEASKIAAAQLQAPPQGQVLIPIGDAFPDFDVKDLDGNSMSISANKGKVVMVDFWATWCPPCRAEVPNVAAVYKKYHDKGFEIIGVSLDRDSDKDKLLSFTKENNMPWRQFFDGKYWQNELAVKYGIRSIPMAFLLDSNGKVIAEGNSIRGEQLEPAVAHALGLKFDVPPPEPTYAGTLVDGSTFPDFQAADLEGKPLSLADYKGKVVMVDFWATWCPPCRAEVPNVVKTYEQYHDKGFEIIGVSLDHPGDLDKLTAFAKENKMTWREDFDGENNGKLAKKYGIQFIPNSFLIDRNGKIVAQGDALRGEALAPLVQKALGSQ